MKQHGNLFTFAMQWHPSDFTQLEEEQYELIRLLMWDGMYAALEACNIPHSSAGFLFSLECVGCGDCTLPDDFDEACALIRRWQKIGGEVMDNESRIYFRIAYEDAGDD